MNAVYYLWDRKNIYILSALALFAFLSFVPDAMGEIYFDDTAPSIIRLGSSNYYEYGFSKTNGCLRYIKDLTVGGTNCVGTLSNHLWRVMIPRTGGGGSSVGGANYMHSMGFSYAWSNEVDTLSFVYSGDTGLNEYASAEIAVTASEGSWCDFQIVLDNHYTNAIQNVQFPYRLTLKGDEIHEAMMPIKPGAIVNSNFFQEERSYVSFHPSGFTDMLSVDTTQGDLSIYSLWTPTDFRPVFVGLEPMPDQPDPSAYVLLFDFT